MAIQPRLKALLLILLFAPGSLLAESHLTIAKAFNVLAVNGTSYAKGLISQNRDLTLRTGKNRLVIEYEEVFESDDDDNFDIVKSTPFLLEVYLQKDKNYQQRIVKPASVKAAKQFASQPLFDIVEINDNQPGPKVAFTITALASNNTAFLIQQSRLRQNTTLDLSHPNPKSSKMPAQKSLTAEPPPSMASKMLHYWWQQATPEEREAFLEAINN